MTSSTSRIGIGLSALHAATFAGIGVYLPFFPVWLESKGLAPTLIGAILAIPIVVRVVLTAPLMTLSDGGVGPRGLLIASHLGQLAVVPILAFADGALALALGVALLAVFQAAVVPANDYVTTDAVRRHQRLHYGRIRGFGSVSFLLASIGAGYLVQGAGAGAILWALAVTPLLGLAATHFAVPARRAEVRFAEAPRPAATAHLPPALWLVLAAAALTQGSHGGLYAFGSIHWRSLGMSDAVIGYLWAIGVVAEIGVFYWLGQAVGRGSAGLGLLLAGSAAAAVRFALMAWEPGLAATVALQAMHGLSFGASHLGAMAAIAALAPDAARGRALGLASSLTALCTASAVLASGPIYRATGPGVFLVMAPAAALAFLLALAALRAQRRQVRATRLS